MADFLGKGDRSWLIGFGEAEVDKRLGQHRLQRWPVMESSIDDNLKLKAPTLQDFQGFEGESFADCSRTESSSAFCDIPRSYCWRMRQRDGQELSDSFGIRDSRFEDVVLSREESVSSVEKDTMPKCKRNLVLTLVTS